MSASKTHDSDIAAMLGASAHLRFQVSHSMDHWVLHASDFQKMASTS